MRRSWSLLALTGALLFLAVGSVRADNSGGTEVDLGGLKSTAPADWKQEQSGSAMRVYQFVVPHAEGDTSDANVTVFFFQGGGGSAEDNIKRWKGMFEPPEGKTIDDISKVEKMKVADNDVTLLDVHGTYKFKARPFDPNAAVELKPNYRMVAVVFETKNGPYYIRFVGPAKTVGQHNAEFDRWLKGFK